MLAAATSSRPAVTRRAYECGAVDTDVESIVTDRPAVTLAVKKLRRSARPRGGSTVAVRKSRVIRANRTCFVAA